MARSAKESALLRRQPRRPPRAHQGRVRHLIYLDPPFNSRQDYNVLFAERACPERSRRGTRSSSQIMAFEDTWEWNMDAEAAYQEMVERRACPERSRRGRVSDAMRAFRTFLGHSDMMAYLAASS